MQFSFLTTYFLPFAVCLIMFGMGLSLTLNDFKRIFTDSRVVIIGLFAQLVMLPAVGFLIAASTPLSPVLAVGLVVLTACPAGSTSNIISLLAKGDVALSITLTACSSLISIVTIPLVVNLAMQTFLGENSMVQLPFLSTVLQIVFVTALPVSLGMLARRYYPRFAQQAEKPIRWWAIAFLAIIILGIIVQAPADNFLFYILTIGWITLLLNVVTMTLGFAIAFFLKLRRPSIVTITVEVGIQNGGLALAIAASPTLLNTPEMAMPAAIYTLLMFFTGGGFALWSSRYFTAAKPSPSQPSYNVRVH